MASRNQARQDAAFARGAVGVDGSATEEVRDKAEVERDKAREQFLRGKAWLGRELLTWLLFRSESSEPLFVLGKAPVSVLLADRLVLRAIDGEVVDCTVRGAQAPYAKLVREALRRGLLVHQARLHIAHGERSFEVALDAEFFDLKSAKLPALVSEEDDDRLRERLELSEELGAMVEAIQEDFLRLRTSRRWAKEVVPEMLGWMAAGERGSR
jgi:hypothetical protein